MEDISKTPTVELVKEITNLSQQIDLLILKYEKVRLELIKRFPNLKEDEEFKPKRR